jgi:hypothetical protein
MSSLCLLVAALTASHWPIVPQLSTNDADGWPFRNSLGEGPQTANHGVEQFPQLCQSLLAQMAE